jgi:methanogenic corrinoid protein MtbC1
MGLAHLFEGGADSGGISVVNIASASQSGADFWRASPGTDRLALEDWPTAIDAKQRPANAVAGLVKMVESEIIPRLMLAHRNGGTEAANAKPVSGLGQETTETFARMVVSRDSDSLVSFVGGLLQAGVSLDSIYTDLLVPAARRLGEYWDEDSVSFTDVTVGLGRLQQVMRAIAWKTPGAGDRAGLARSALFAPGPCEQHVFGLYIIDDFFRRAGWSTWVETSSDTADLVDTVRGHWFDLFGVTVSVDDHISEIAATIRAVRAASRNPQLYVMIGGRLIADRPELVAEVGADATAGSGGEALLVANHALLIVDNALSAQMIGA